MKYSPPAGHVGDTAGYVRFLDEIVGRYGDNPRVRAFVIGNEANVYGNPNASDGAFPGAETALVQGTIAVGRSLARSGSAAKVGVNFAPTGTASDSAFLQRLVTTGGSDFVSAVQFVGVDVYPDIWSPGTGRPYADTVAVLESARGSVGGIAGWQGLPIEILELGAPMVDETSQANRLTQIVNAVLDNHERLGITSLHWFDLWDANTQSSNPFAHYGLLRSDLGKKPAFDALKNIIAESTRP